MKTAHDLFLLLLKGVPLETAKQGFTDEQIAEAQAEYDIVSQSAYAIGTKMEDEDKPAKPLTPTQKRKATTERDLFFIDTDVVKKSAKEADFTGVEIVNALQTMGADTTTVSMRSVPELNEGELTPGQLRQLQKDATFFDRYGSAGDDTRLLLESMQMMNPLNLPEPTPEQKQVYAGIFERFRAAMNSGEVTVLTVDSLPEQDRSEARNKTFTMGYGVGILDGLDSKLDEFFGQVGGLKRSDLSMFGALSHSSPDYPKSGIAMHMLKSRMSNLSEEEKKYLQWDMPVTTAENTTWNEQDREAALKQINEGIDKLKAAAVPQKLNMDDLPMGGFNRGLPLLFTAPGGRFFLTPEQVVRMAQPFDNPNWLDDLEGWGIVDKTGGDPGPKGDPGISLERAFLNAQRLGYTGTLDDFKKGVAGPGGRVYAHQPKPQPERVKGDSRRKLRTNARGTMTYPEPRRSRKPNKFTN